MRKFLFVIFLISLIVACNNKPNPVCNCCEITYKYIEDALKCIDDNPRETSYDNRLLLLAFTDSNTAGWNLIKDSEIIAVAKRDYLLVTLNKTESAFLYKEGPSELINVMQKHQDEKLFFIVANRALFPFRDWNESEPKKSIIDKLGIGDGP